MQIKFSRKFIKMYAKAPAKIRQAFKKRQNLFIQDPHHPQLNNHALTSKYSDSKSINITGNWRAIFKEKNGDIYFRLIGTHSQLYK